MSLLFQQIASRPEHIVRYLFNENKSERKTYGFKKIKKQPDIVNIQLLHKLNNNLEEASHNLNLC